MATSPVSIGPWSGIDNIHQADAKVFQPPGELEKRVAALVQASDVDLDDDGWPSARHDIVEDTALTSGLGGWRILDRMFVQDGAILYEYVSGALVSRVTGLNDRVALCSHVGLIFGSDGTTHFELDGTTLRTWGLPVPTVTLSPGNGTLESGTYLVQVSFVDVRGNEGGTSTIASATLTSATGIVVDVVGKSSDCVGVNVYVSRVDQKVTSWYDTVLLNSLPYMLQSDVVTVGNPPKTEQMTGPISGAAGIFSYRAFLMMWRDGVVFRSEGAEPHLFHGDNIIQFGADVTACEAVAGGMWIGTTNGLWWVIGEEPRSWIPVHKTFDAVLRGSAQVQGAKFPKLGTDDLVALFVTKSGLVAGMPNGQLISLTDNVYTFASALRASITYVERDDLRQLLVGLVT